MLIYQSVIVGVIYLVLGFLEEYLSFPMCSRPMVVGTVIGFFLGDLTTGVMIGASLELVFMGAVQIGASTPRIRWSARRSAQRLRSLCMRMWK